MKSVSPQVAGYSMAVVGSVSYGLNPLFALPLYGVGVTPMSVLFYRYGLTVLLMGLLLAVLGQPFHATRRQLVLSLAMGQLFALSSVCLFVSFKLMDAGIASVILFTYPMFVALISWACFHERLSRVALVSFILAFAGICCLHGDSGGRQSVLGVVMAVASGLSYAVYIVGVNRSVLRTMPAFSLTFYASLSGLVLFFVCCGFGRDLSPLHGASSWGCAAGLALFPTIVSLLLVTRSIHLIGSTPAAIIGALEPITALAVSLLVFGGTLTWLNVAGVALVLFAVCLMMWKNH